MINEIRKRLEAITPGPWVYDGMHNEIQTPEDDDSFWLIVSEVRTHPSEKISDEFGHSFNPDFDFIAHAPTDIKYLLERLEKLEKERDAAVEDIRKTCIYCSKREGWKTCPDASFIEDGQTCTNWQWRGQE